MRIEDACAGRETSCETVTGLTQGTCTYQATAAFDVNWMK